MGINSSPRTPRSIGSVSSGTVRRHQSLCDSRQESHYYAQRHSACTAYKRRTCVVILFIFYKKLNIKSWGKGILVKLLINDCSFTIWKMNAVFYFGIDDEDVFK